MSQEPPTQAQISPLNFLSYDPEQFKFLPAQKNSNGKLLRLAYPGRSPIEWLAPPMRMIFALSGPGIVSQTPSRFPQTNFKFTCAVDTRGGAPEEVMAQYEAFLQKFDKRNCEQLAASSKELFGYEATAEQLVSMGKFWPMLKYNKDHPEYSGVVTYQMLTSRDTNEISTVVKVLRNGSVSERLSHQEIIDIMSDREKRFNVHVRSEVPFGFISTTGATVVPKPRFVLLEEVTLDDEVLDVNMYVTASDDTGGIPFMPLPSFAAATSSTADDDDEDEPSAKRQRTSGDDDDDDIEEYSDEEVDNTAV